MDSDDYLECPLCDYELPVELGVEHVILQNETGSRFEGRRFTDEAQREFRAHREFYEREEGREMFPPPEGGRKLFWPVENP